MDMAEDVAIVTTAERPDLVPVVARWLWDAFGQASGKPFETLLAEVADSATPRPLPRTFILLLNGRPAGTASLVADDLPERPDLTPWLAGVFVVPQARGHGHAGRLVVAVEQAARANGTTTLWLYTNRAERIYARAGWRTVETVQHAGRPFALMMRRLDAARPDNASQRRSADCGNRGSTPCAPR